MGCAQRLQNVSCSYVALVVSKKPRIPTRTYDDRENKYFGLGNMRMWLTCFRRDVGKQLRSPKVLSAQGLEERFE